MGMTLDDIRRIPDRRVEFGFLASRAMPDGALAVALKLGDRIQIMRMYMRSMDQEFHIGYSAIQTRDSFLPTKRRNPFEDSHQVKMDFVVSECVIINADDYDEYTYHQQIPEYKTIPAMETRLLPPPD